MPTWSVWVAYYPDFSAIVVFDNESSAYHYAVENQMMVVELGSGEALR